MDFPWTHFISSKRRMRLHPKPALLHSGIYYFFGGGRGGGTNRSWFILLFLRSLFSSEHRFYWLQRKFICIHKWNAIRWKYYNRIGGEYLRERTERAKNGTDGMTEWWMLVINSMQPSTVCAISTMNSLHQKPYSSIITFMPAQPIAGFGFGHIYFMRLFVWVFLLMYDFTVARFIQRHIGESNRSSQHTIRSNVSGHNLKHKKLIIIDSHGAVVKQKKKNKGLDVFYLLFLQSFYWMYFHLAQT